MIITKHGNIIKTCPECSGTVKLMGDSYGIPTFFQALIDGLCLKLLITYSKYECKVCGCQFMEKNV